MLDEISSDTFKERVQQREKRTQKMREIHLLLQMFVNTMADLLRQTVMEKDFVEKEVLVRALIDYSNTNIGRISKRYSCVVPCINVEHMRIDNTKIK